MSKSKEAEAPAKILKYLIDTNRPYSTIDITANLHKEFGKTCVQRTLDTLVVDGKVTEKVYGKQKVYYANQNNFPSVNDSELKEMDRRITELQATLKKTSEECHKIEGALSSLTHSLKSEEAKEQLKSLTTEVSEMEKRLTVIKTGKDSVSPEESKKIHSSHQECFRQWRKRKRMASDILNSILEGYPKSKKELYVFDPLTSQLDSLLDEDEEEEEEEDDLWEIGLEMAVTGSSAADHSDSGDDSEDDPLREELEGKPPDAKRQAIIDVMSQTEVTLDPTFTIKGYMGMVGEMKKHPSVLKGKRALLFTQGVFMHCFMDTLMTQTEKTRV